MLEHNTTPHRSHHPADLLSSPSSPRAESLSSSVANRSYESHTSYASHGYEQEVIAGPKRDFHHAPPYHYPPHSYGSMNQGQPYMEVNQPHPQGSGPPPGMPQYPNYGHPIQPAAHGYAPAYPPQYSYTMAPMQNGHPVTSSMAGPMVPQALPLPTMASNGPPPPPPPPPGSQYGGNFDQTGQIAPHGMKPRVTATLWEDEGSLCFQVEANGVCVARREDNHMINGTKLLNVAGMTRGRRDGILKSEKTRHVVKIGPMHLKGVWYVIPFLLPI